MQNNPEDNSLERRRRSLLEKQNSLGKQRELPLQQNLIDPESARIIDLPDNTIKDILRFEKEASYFSEQECERIYQEWLKTIAGIRKKGTKGLLSIN